MQSGIRDEDGADRMVNGTATLSLHRIWNQNWQTTRRTLLLNGEQIAEPDYPALHCRLIYDLAVRPMPDRPFEIDGFERSEVKRAFYTMVNAPSRDSAQRAIWKHSPRWNELMPAIERKHSAVGEALCSGIGARLMFIDATIMCRNLADLNREGIIALPIHDSVLVQAKYESKALEIMDRNLPILGSRKGQKSAHLSASQVVDGSEQNSPTDLNFDLHNGHSGSAGRVAVGWAVPPVPSWAVTLLPADLASLAVVAWFYGAGEVRGYEAN